MNHVVKGFLTASFILIVLTLILLATIKSTEAADIVLSNGITVSDRIVAPKVKFDDIDLANASKEEFAAWCAKYNEKQLADAKVRHDKYLAERGPMPTKIVSGSSGSSNTRVGGGYGAGGFGGAGGYLGYGNTVGGGGYGGGGGGYYSMGNASIGNNTSSGYSTNSYSFEQKYPDMNDNGGGPVTYINPYCHDYWVAQYKSEPQPRDQVEHYVLPPAAQKPAPTPPAPSEVEPEPETLFQLP